MPYLWCEFRIGTLMTWLLSVVAFAHGLSAQMETFYEMERDHYMGGIQKFWKTPFSFKKKLYFWLLATLKVLENPLLSCFKILILFLLPQSTFCHEIKILSLGKFYFHFMYGPLRIVFIHNSPLKENFLGLPLQLCTIYDVNLHCYICHWTLWLH